MDMKFELSEKLAIVHVIDSVIQADGVIHKGEINALGKLMKVIDFDTNFIISARNVIPEQGNIILRRMDSPKKAALATMLKEMAKADGFVHQKEITLITELFSQIGIFEKMEPY